MNDQFDKKLERYGHHIPENMKSALIDVNDTMEFAVCMIEQNMGVKAYTTADVVALTRLVLEQEATLHMRLTFSQQDPQ